MQCHQPVLFLLQRLCLGHRIDLKASQRITEIEGQAHGLDAGLGLGCSYSIHSHTTTWGGADEKNKGRKGALAKFAIDDEE